MPKVADATKKATPRKAAAAKRASPPKDEEPARPAAEEMAPVVEGLNEAADEWATATLADEEDVLNILYYGVGGTGKTTDVAHMANLGRILYVNAESGIKRRPLAKLGVKVENVVLLPGPNRLLTFELLEDAFWRMKADLEEDPKAWTGVVWDSLTEIHKKLLDNVVAGAVQKAERLGRDRDRFFIDRSDWGDMTEQVRLLLRRFRDLPCHFAVTALERREQDDEDGKVAYVPAVNPALQADLQLFFDVVCHTTLKEKDGVEEYHGMFRPVGKYKAAKDRLGALPRGLVDPNVERVLAYVTEDLDLDSDPVMQEALARRQREAAQAAEQETN